MRTAKKKTNRLSNGEIIKLAQFLEQKKEQIPAGGLTANVLLVEASHTIGRELTVANLYLIAAEVGLEISGGVARPKAATVTDDDFRAIVEQFVYYATQELPLTPAMAAAAERFGIIRPGRRGPDLRNGERHADDLIKD